ncbi:MAG TPA: hypothetical protein VF789_05010 [Thermoanaerobaculia bacterium]
MKKNRPRKLSLSKEMLSSLDALLSVYFAVILILLAAPAGAQDLGNRGTYATLDAEAIRVKTVFSGAYAVAEVFNEDEIHTQLYSDREDFLGEVILSKNKMSLRANFPKVAAGAVDLKGIPHSKLTKDWANLQVYSLWLDLQSTASSESALKTLVWQGQGFRPMEVATKAGVQDVQAHWGRTLARVRSVTTEFDFFTAVAKRDPLPKAGSRDADTAYSTFSTELRSHNGERLGLLRWFDRESVLVWDFPGLTQGFVDNERLPGGFSFRPDMGWSNLQSYAFWKFHSELTIFKNEPGCDGLHWLDDSILRPCCDDHDLCYEKYGCTASSWWVIGSSWSCIKCNLTVVFCFVTGGGGSGGGGGGTGGGGGACTRAPGAWCPAECFSCSGGGGGPMAI